jgi:putative nucleotidyltransferase with HDIG domain
MMRSAPRKQAVASGNFVVDSRQPLVLEAYLGTCVGVTICDKKNGIGGLIHLLLPEWTGIDKPWRPESYAKTGLPLFIQALCDAGAEKETMESCVAGGALIGPLSKVDFDLDIGGRTEDIVRTILADEGIPVYQAETGGYYSCRLNFDMQTFQTTIHPITPHEIDEHDATPRPMPDDLDAMFSRVRPIPQIALKIIRLINDQSYTIHEIADEIKQDQVIAAAVIRLCNSTFIGMKRKVDSVDRALVTLGEKRLLQMVVSTSLEPYFSDSSQGYSLCKGGLFRHALGVATMAEVLAEFTGSVLSEIAYTSGLLHDIGKVVLDQYMATAHLLFYRKTQVDTVDLCDVEKEKFGRSHTEMGSLLAESWSLPDNLVDTIRFHHTPERATVDKKLTHIVYFADLLMSRFQAGQELECLNIDRFRSRLEAVGLTLSQLAILIDLIPQNVFDQTQNGASFQTTQQDRIA